MFVLTVDQIASRHQPDQVDQAVAALGGIEVTVPFARTVGDEFQGVVADASSVVEAVLALLRPGIWHVGLGIGAVERPLPADTRTARGPAFLAARTAVERAKDRSGHVCVVAVPASVEAEDAEVVLALLTALHQRRSSEGWAAVDAMQESRSQAEAAVRLGVSRQAVSQRLQAASWALEQRTLPVLARLLGRADTAA